MIDVQAMQRGAEAPVEAARGDLPGVIDDLADAFADDPQFNWFFRTDARRDDARLKFFRLLITGMAFGVGRIERPAGGGAAAVWMPFEFVGPTPMIQELLALPTLLYVTGLSRFSRLVALRADMDKHHPMDRPHAYLWFLGVKREAQGKGVGSRLLKVASDRLDAAGQHAYLETQTERNGGLYRRFGFEVISEHRARPDAPPLWSMWREAGAPSTR